MAGHSKWANIKFKKAAQDAKRGKLFTKFIREITVAARQGGADVSSNPRLRAAVDKALSGNMTRDAIERAIKRGAGGEEGQNMEEVRYEGYGPGGVAVMVDCLTDNRNRTVSEVRHAFSKAGGNLGTDGSVAYLFNKLGQIIVDAAHHEEEVIDIVLEAGADDVETQEDGTIEILTALEAFESTKVALEQANIIIQFAEVSLIPSNQVALDAETSQKLLTLVDRLEDLDDVQVVVTNADLDESVIGELS